MASDLIGNATILTCDHVIRDLGREGLLVNGRDAVEAPFPKDDVDATLLHVALDGPVALVGGPPRSERVFGWAYRHVAGQHYACFGFEARTLGGAYLRSQSDNGAKGAFRLQAAAGTFVPGNSGAPIFDEDGRLVGMLVFASPDGKEGLALQVSDLAHHWSAVKDARNGEVLRDEQRKTQVELSPTPLPKLAPITDKDDLNKGRFGGAPFDAGVRLTAKLISTSSHYFTFDLVVTPIAEDAKPLRRARFYLHDTYPRSIIDVRKSRKDGTLVLEEVQAWGGYTVGCHALAADGNWRSLELDLCKAFEGEVSKTLLDR